MLDWTKIEKHFEERNAQEEIKKQHATLTGTYARIESFDNVGLSKYKIDGVEYIVAKTAKGVAIIKHEPKQD